MRFEFGTPGRIIFGAGRLREAGDIAKGLGKRPLVVTGRTPDRARPLFALLREQTMDAVTFAVTREPDLEVIRAGTALARGERCDCVIGFGGGAALDAAKAIAVLLTNQGDVLDYLEIIGRGRALTEAPVPLMAVPTTAGTGTEVTRNSVIASPKHRVKVSLRSPLMLPKVALVDPELTYHLPPALTATTGLDALAQLIEPFVCTRANPLTDGLCQEGITRVARSLRRAVAAARDAAGRDGDPTPEDAAAREDMAVASLFGGLALANAGLGAVHGLAGPLGGMVPAPHGAVCAALLPGVVAANLRALRERAPQSDALRRYERVAELLTGGASTKGGAAGAGAGAAGAAGATAGEAVEWLRKLVADLDIPRLGAHEFRPEHIPELVEKAMAASSMKANPIELTRDELAAIVEAAL
jgi:alcohol dehydrogenase class IV